jgi:hypothetical protein
LETAEILTLRQTVSNLQSLGFGGGRQPKTDRVIDKKRGKQRSGGQEPPVDLAYIKERGEVCRDWNTPADCTRTTCSKKHVCNMRTGPGKCCKQGHRAVQHP